jgi:drug/metabolite transporter (DMT)-like permease
VGYLFAVLGMLCFGLLGILSKMSDRRKCPPLATTFCLFSGSTLLTAISVTLFQGAGFAAPAFVVGIALAFGVVTVLASWVFLYALQFGKITTSWVILNLSAIVPAVGSIAIYGEPFGVRKLFLLLLVFVSILLLWKDMVEEHKRAMKENAVSGFSATRIGSEVD